MNGTTRNAVVTGGGTGTGRAVGFAATITGTGKRTPDDLGVHAIAVDAADLEQVVWAVDELPGSVHVLVADIGNRGLRLTIG